MAEGYVIGVDLGGTKLLAGAVGADLSVIHRTNRPVYGLSQDELVQMVVDAMEEIRTAVGGEVEAIGFGVPCLIDQRSGTRCMCVNLPLNDIPFRDVMSERLGMPVFIDNDANVATLCRGAVWRARGATDVGAADDRHRDRRRAGLRRQALSRLARRRRRAGSHGDRRERPPCQGNCPNYGCLESVASGTAIGREARWRSRGGPDSDARARGDAGREITGALVTQLALGGDEVSRMGSGHRPRARHRRRRTSSTSSTPR